MRMRRPGVLPQPQQRRGQLLGLLRRNQQAFDAIRDRLWHPAAAAGDDWHPHAIASTIAAGIPSVRLG